MFGFGRKQAEEKALSEMRHPGRAPWLLGFLKRTRFDYAKEVGSGIDSSVVTAPLQWIQRAFPEGRLQVMGGPADDRKEKEAHPLVELIRQPNPHYGDAALWAATIFSYGVAGNAYWIKARPRRLPEELWYAPHWMIQPKWPDDGSAFISHYEYKPGSNVRPIRLEVEDVVHFRHGIDPGNMRLGLSPLHGVLREIFMDLEASNFVASLLRNMGVPGAVISPDGGGQATPDDVEAVKSWFKDAFGGDRRGAPLVMGGPTKVQQYGFNPQQMDLSVARDVAEERVCACLGIPAAVVGFGAGLQTAKVGATMSELRTLAWTNGVVPLMRSFADELQRAMAEMLDDGDEVRFDTDGVMALAEFRLSNATSWNTMVQGGWAQVAEARQAMGLDVDDSHRIYLRPFSAIETPAGQPARAPSAGGGDDGGSEGDPDPAERGAPDGGKKDDHDHEDERLRRAPRASATQRERGRRYVRALSQIENGLSSAVEGRLKGFFGKLGRTAAEAARPVLEAELMERAAAPGATKSDQIVVEAILQQLELPLEQRALKEIYERHFLKVAEEVAQAGKIIGLAADLPDPVARAVVAAGGRRSGLVDLTAQSRAALFDALAEGRAAGEGAQQLAGRIADEVGGGPWTSPEIRARTIARTETKFAQNVSTLASAGHAGVQQFVIFDGRLGPGRSDPNHIARDGLIVDAETANQMAAEEHPNGTLSFAPYFQEDEE